MADKKKSILDEALLDAKRIQEALNANSKEILASLTKEEIDSIVKESLEEDYLEEDVDTDNEEELETGEEELETGEEEEAGEEEDEAGEEESEIEGDEVGASMDSIEGDDLEGDYESGMDALASDDEAEIDMTTASDDDVIAVYKKLTGDDEIEVVVDDEAGEVHLSVNEPGEFVIKTGEGEVEGGEEIDVDSMDYMDDMDDEAGEVEDEVMYEIALDEMENIEGTKSPIASGDNFGGSTTDEDGEKGFKEKPGHANAEGDMVMSEEDESLEESEELTEEDEVAEGEEPIEEKTSSGLGMSVGKHRNQSGPGSIGAPEGPGAKVNESKVIKKYNTLLTEAKELKGRNNEYKQALKQFRTMLAETVVFNSNLTYVTKLFMEHSTTKDEKENIFKRFDNEVSTLKESKRLYKTIESELKNRKPLNESIENKIMKEVSTSKSTQLNESTAYVDKETSRIMDLMKRVNNR